MDLNKKKRVLLLMPKFHGYQDLVIEHLQKLDFEVEYFENKTHKFDPDSYKAKFRIIRRVWFKIFKPKAKYTSKLLKLTKNSIFDYLLVINCNSLTTSFLKSIKIANPEIKTRLFLWDTLKCYDWVEFCQEFDVVYTFDLFDAQKYNIKYLANFHDYFDEESPLVSRYSIVFIGTHHSNRFSLIDKLYPVIKANFSNSFIRLIIIYKPFFYNKFLYFLISKFFYKIFPDLALAYKLFEKRITTEFLQFERINYNDVKDIYLNANVILDIDMPEQTGLSQRVILGLAQGKKIITTNQFITYYKDIYDPKVIHIIDENKPVLDINWIRESSAGKMVDLSYLRIDNWLTKILGE